MYFRTEGIIISQKNFGEADKLLKIYTRDFGKMSVLAKGVRRPKSRKAGHVELGNWCKLFLARGKNIDLLAEVQVKKAFGVADFTPAKANRIFHLLEIVDSLTFEKQKNLSIFILLVQFLKKIATEEDFNLVSAVFKVKLLSILGFFSAKNLKNSSTKDLLEIIEVEDFEDIKERFRIKPSSYLKLLSFLDSIIESLIEKKLATSRFLSGQV